MSIKPGDIFVHKKLAEGLIMVISRYDSFRDGKLYQTTVYMDKLGMHQNNVKKHEREIEQYWRPLRELL